jgi:lipopolysaccharide export system permease protein
MLGPFMVGVLGFVMMMAVDLLFTMADLIINRGVPLWAMLKLLYYKLPSIMVMTFPVSTLFATAMVLGRLGKENEIVALRTSGVSLLRIARPIILVSIVVSLLSYFTNEKIVPHANYVAANIIRQIIYKQPLPEVKDNVFFKDAFNRFYYARRVDMKTKKMEGVVIYEVQGDIFPRVILANEVEFSGKKWELKKGIVHKYDKEGFLNYEAAFENMRINVSENVVSFSSQKDAQEMDSRELTGMITQLERGGVKTNALRTELLMKYSIPATCLVFALVGIPFSLPTPRSGRTWGLIITIVFMFTFYVFASVFRSLGKGGILSPELAAFTPQAVFALVGIVLLGWEGLRK